MALNRSKRHDALQARRMIMSVGSTGIVGSLAGGQLQQTKGADAEAVQHAAGDQARRAQSARSAEAASGVGETEQDHEAEQRDADGRRLWERQSTSTPTEPPVADPAPPSPAKDPSGQRGSQLDLLV